MVIVPRSEWGARPAKRITMFRKPAAELYCHHLAAEWHGAAGMRSAQKFHQDTRGWRDIAYTFCVDDDGTIYEGTGPHVVGTHTRDRNSRAMAICAMGDFDKRSPTPQMLASISWLIRHGQSQGWWGGLTGGHRDAPGASTACPGRYLYARIPQLKAAAQAAGSQKPSQKPSPNLEDDMPAPKHTTAVVPCPTGGYWRVEADGGVFAEDGAPFFGSLFSIPEPLRQLAPDEWVVGLGPKSHGGSEVVGYVLVTNHGDRYDLPHAA